MIRGHRINHVRVRRDADHANASRLLHRREDTSRFGITLAQLPGVVRTTGIYGTSLFDILIYMKFRLQLLRVGRGLESFASRSERGSLGPEVELERLAGVSVRLQLAVAHGGDDPRDLCLCGCPD